jgi:hypothetical protein
MLLATVSLEKHPWLLTCPRGEVVRVQGQISGVDPLSIDLKEVRLTQVSCPVAGSSAKEVHVHG